MAIEPFRQRIGITSPGSLISSNAPQVSDPGAAIRSIGRSIMEAAEPTLQRKAVEAGAKAAGAATIERDAQGNPIKIARPAGGGDLFNAAFDKVSETRYLNQVSYDFQNYLNTEINDRRVGKDGKVFDPDQFEAAVQGRLEGMLKSVDPDLRPAVEETVFREALERTRSFRDEWGRTHRGQAIAGAKDQIDVLLNGYANFRQEGLDAGQAYEKYGSKLDALVQRMQDLGQIGGAEADALLMRVDNLVDSAESYAISMGAANKFIPVIGGLDSTDTEILGNWLRGAPDPRQLNGVTLEGSQDDPVTPDSLKETLKQIAPGAVLTSGARAADDPLTLKNPTSYHSVANGGRAVDVAPIKGMSFDEYVQRWRNAGFDVVEAIEEVGSKRSPHSTGDHWHVALGNTRKVQGTKDNPEVKGLTFNDIDRLDPSVKRSLLSVVTNREQAIREREALDRAAAAEVERDRKERERSDRLITSITGALSNGMGGNWNAEQRGVFEQSFTKAIDLSKISDPQVQANALRFIQTNQYVPEGLVNYMANTVRSNNWRSAVQLFRNIKNANVGNATIGDLLIEGLDPRSKALLTTADDLIASGQPDSVVTPRIEQLRSGNGFTVDEAKAEFTRIAGKGREGAYRQVRDQKIREAYGFPSNIAIPSSLSKRIDESFAAGLDVQNRDPSVSLDKAIIQHKGVYTKSGIFFEGVGPSVLTRTYTQQQLADFFVAATDKGRRVAPPFKGADGVTRNHSIGSGGTIKLTPLDNNVSGIGRYQVTLFDPGNKSNIINSFPIDLGAELNKWASSRPAPKVPDPIAAARANRSATQRFLETLAPPDRSRSVVGPKM